MTGAEFSASTQMRAIDRTVSTGYLPLAVSAESITASVPSSTALATSDTSARVGTGLAIIDSIICVAVMVSLLCSRAMRIMRFCSAGTEASPTSTARSPRATMMPSRGRHDVLQRAGRHRFGAFDLGDQEGFAAGGAQQLPRHVHVRARFRKRHREKIHLDRGGGADVVHVLGRERRRGQAAAAAVDALVVRQHAAVVHAAVHPVALDPFHLEFDAAVVEQQHVARAHVARQFLIVQTDALLVAELAIGVENESVAPA